MASAICSPRSCAILAALAGAVVVVAALARGLGMVPPHVAEIMLYVSLPLLCLALVGAIRPCVAQALPRREDRFAMLRRLGVSEYAALILAHDPSFSIDDLIRLLAKGCPLGTALRILWPA